jgi:hypothetical protein
MGRSLSYLLVKYFLFFYRLQDDDSGVFQVKDSNFSPNSDGRMSRFLNDVSTLQSSEQSSMLQFRLDEAIKTITAERK